MYVIIYANKIGTPLSKLSAPNPKVDTVTDYLCEEISGKVIAQERINVLIKDLSGLKLEQELFVQRLGDLLKKNQLVKLQKHEKIC